LFTGLVECIGVVRAVSRDQSVPGVMRITVGAPDISGELRRGDSVAVSGVCLTVVEASREAMSAQIMQETLRSTKLGKLVQGDRVNLERALRVDGRLDGHIVQGHVDEVGRVLRVESVGDGAGTKKIWISVPRGIAWGIAPKGSICLDGVSLTVIDAEDEAFSVGLIPTTLAETTIGSLASGDAVNIEIDVMARYLARMLRFGALEQETRAGEVSALTWEKLQDYGWS
jgi:riboflavin synthase